ncbi:hypothetical protein B0O99DRAFT_287553 [Bisporella sp. PMI_857]|nr:hypothetical protein B0O99DRAFT_287553 [Bisporella sp. PMI_857]
MSIDLRPLTARPANLDELLIDAEESIRKETSDDDDDDDAEDGIENLEFLEITGTDDDKKRDLDALRNKTLDRLAETLARYKSDPKGGKGSILDPKNVSSAVMIRYDDENKVKILCAKNEGLAQGNSTVDMDFLNSWKACMERISRAGTRIRVLGLSHPNKP